MSIGRFISRGILCLLSILYILHGTSWAWNDRTHMAIAKAAGYWYWYYAAAADVAKIKAGTIEERNHYFGNDKNAEISTKTVLDQAERYNNPNDTEGHLYGAIIASLREFRVTKSLGKDAEYQMAYAVHYIGDLSEPLHNIPYDSFNKAHHSINDNTVENVMDRIEEIQKNMYEIKLRPDHFEEDLAKEIARIANVSRVLGIKLRTDNRDMTSNEGLTQIGHSASLLKAVLEGIGKSDR
jgi:hypothetical protein